MRTFALTIVVMLFCIGSVNSSAEARPNLLLTFINDSKQQLDVKLTGGSSGHIEDVGSISAGASVPYSLPVRNGATVQAIASLIESAVVDTQQFTVRNELTKTLHIDVHNGSVVLDTAADQLANDLTKLGPPSNLPPLDKDTAVAQFLGAVVIRQAGDPEASPIDIIGPSIINPSLSASDVVFNSAELQDDVKISSSMDAKVAATIPVLLDLGLSFNQSTLNEVQYLIAGAGQMTTKKPLVALSQALQNASSEKTTVCSGIARFKDPEILYITTMYGFSQASFTTTTGLKVAAGVQASGSTFINGSIGYTFDSSHSTLKAIGPEVINYTGVSYPLSVWCDADKTVKVAGETVSSQATDISAAKPATVVTKIGVSQRISNAVPKAASVSPALFDKIKTPDH